MEYLLFMNSFTPAATKHHLPPRTVQSHGAHIGNLPTVDLLRLAWSETSLVYRARLISLAYLKLELAIASEREKWV